MGGSDQWGNITAGVDLIRKADGGKAFALVCPLLTTASGQKMGKSEGNSVWLDRDLTSPYDFYQYWINVDDADVERLLRLYTFLPESRIRELTAEGGETLREAKRVLAQEVTTLAHGEEATLQAEAAARALFGNASDLDEANVPTLDIPAAEVSGSLAGRPLCPLRSRRLARRGAAKGRRRCALARRRERSRRRRAIPAGERQRAVAVWEKAVLADSLRAVDRSERSLAGISRR